MPLTSRHSTLPGQWLHFRNLPVLSHAGPSDPAFLPWVLDTQGPCGEKLDHAEPGEQPGDSRAGGLLSWPVRAWIPWRIMLSRCGPNEKKQTRSNLRDQLHCGYCFQTRAFCLEMAGVFMLGAALSMAYTTADSSALDQNTPPRYKEIKLYPKSLTRMEKILAWNAELLRSSLPHLLPLGLASVFLLLINPANQPLPFKGIWRKRLCQVPAKSLWHSRTWARLLCRLRKSEKNKDYRETVYLSLQGLVLHLWNLRFSYYNEVLL